MQRAKFKTKRGKSRRRKREQIIKMPWKNKQLYV